MLFHTTSAFTYAPACKPRLNHLSRCSPPHSRLSARATMATPEKVSTGYLFHESYFWHNPGFIQNFRENLEPWRHWENAETKRR